MKPEQLKELRELAYKSTKVVEWYPHSGGDSYGEEATVRGPFFRWLKVLEVSPQYKKNVADAVDDAKFAAAAMNGLVPLLDHIDQLEKRLTHLESTFSKSGIEVIEQNRRLREALQVAMRSVQSDATLSLCQQALSFGSKPKPTPPFETFTKPYCKGSFALGSACGRCEKCEWETGYTR